MPHPVSRVLALPELLQARLFSVHHPDALRTWLRALATSLTAWSSPQDPPAGAAMAQEGAPGLDLTDNWSSTYGGCHDDD